MPKIELQAAGKCVGVDADEMSAKQLGKLAVKLWNAIEFPKGTRQPFGVSMPSDQPAADDLRYEDGELGGAEVMR